VFVPQTSIASRVTGLRETLETRFPFNIAAQLGSFWDDTTGSASGLPEYLGWMALHFDALAPFFATAKLVVSVFIFAAFLWWLIDRLTPQVVI
jgi:hypothetical protein